MDRPDAMPTAATAKTESTATAESTLASDDTDAIKFFSTKKTPSPKPKDDTPCQKVGWVFSSPSEKFTEDKVSMFIMF
jgi:hypothetical protein